MQYASSYYKANHIFTITVTQILCFFSIIFHKAYKIKTQSNYMPLIKGANSSEVIQQKQLSIETMSDEEKSSSDVQLALDDVYIGSQKFRVVQNFYRHEGSSLFLLKDYEEKQLNVMKVIEKSQNNDSKKQHQLYEKQFCELNESKILEHVVTIKNIEESAQRIKYTMEYGCGGDLNNIVLKAKGIKTRSEKVQHLKTIKNILWQIIIGLEQIHNLGYIMRDLKPTNILLCEDEKIKICDFGLVIRKGQIDGSICGTPEYMSPQRLSQKRFNIPIDESVDSWSLGIVAYQLLIGSTPFAFNGKIQGIIDQIYGGYVSFDQTYPSYCKHFIFNLLQTNRKKRMNLDQVKNHQFFADLR